jgi:AraC-like DNA-binding protein
MGMRKGRVVSFTAPDIDPPVTLTHGYDIVNNFPVHFHAAFVIGIIEQGNRILQLRGRGYPVSAGDIFLIQPFEPHRIYSADGMGHTYKVISFFFHDLSKHFFPDLVLRDHDLYSTIGGFHNPAEYGYSKDGRRALLDKIKQQLLACALPCDRPAVKGRDNIEKARKYIEARCLEEMSVVRIASEACLSPYHFSRLFHRHTGMSPYAYAVFSRVKKAARLLNAEKSLTDIAYDCSFFDQSHFIKTFKKHVGVPPGRYESKPG